MSLFYLNKRGILRRSVFLAAFFAVFLGCGNLAFSGDESRFELIRDAEIENYLRSLSSPIFKAADIDEKSVSLVLIKNNSINAFVAGGMNIFFHTGLLQKTDTPEQLAAVIAHETGHITGGHLVRGTQAMKKASAEAILGMILGVAAGIASGSGGATIGAIGGAHEIAQRGLMSYSRSQESAADEAAISFFDRAGITSVGMVEFMKKLSGQELLPINRQVEYVRTHPLTQDRVNTVVHHYENSNFKNNKYSPKFEVMHEMMKAKLLGFLHPETALLRYTEKDQRVPAKYALAIALYRTGKLERAVALTDELIKGDYENPFYHELKAQMLFENGKVEASVPEYALSVKLLPDSALLRTAYAHALLEIKNPANLDLAIQNLIESNRLEERSAETWRYLAIAWGKKAELTKNQQYDGLVSYALAEEAAARGVGEEAGRLADRALKILDRKSPYWLKAQDIKLSFENDSSH